MRTISTVALLALIVLLGVAGRMQPAPSAANHTAAADLQGEWRAQLQFASGAFAPIKDLEFMYSFNQGRGVFVERITLSKDGKSFTSKIKYDQFDAAGKPAEGGGTATGKGVKLAF
jgi:hypothetical protein